MLPSAGEFDSTTDPVPVEVVTPVPPFATARVPANVTAPVVAVFGVRPVVPALKEVTPPPPPDWATQEVTPAPSVDRTYPLVPAEVGKVSVQVPAAAAVLTVTVPEDEPFRPNDEALRVVKAPVVGVVAPTVPLMLIEAVPVALVSVMAEGVPKLGVINVGLVASTLSPLPVFVTLTMFLLESSASAVLAVSAERFVVPFTVRPVLQVVFPAK
jgi:hypothetical protein